MLHWSDIDNIILNQLHRIHLLLYFDIFFLFFLIGIAGGSHSDMDNVLAGGIGGGSNYLCLPNDPIFRENRAPGFGRADVHGAEYENPPVDGVADDDDVPCAVCQAIRRSVLMIPARNQCYPGWTIEYTGYLAAEYNENLRTEFVCIDDTAEPVENTGANVDGVRFFPAIAKCGTLPCSPYIQDRELLCVVCTR